MSESTMRVIESLLTLASHASTPPEEAQRAQEKAEALMEKHKIDRAIANFGRSEKEVLGEVIEVKLQRLNLVDPNAVGSSRRDTMEFQTTGIITGLRGVIYTHAGCMAKGDLVMGYQDDIAYAEILWLAVFNEALQLMFPRWSKEVGFDENVYRLKKAGYSWPQVREMGIANEARDCNGVLTQQNAGSKLRTAYRRHCKSIGEEIEGSQPRDPHWWRVSFAHSFSTRISQRVAALRAGREQYQTPDNLPALVRDQDIVKRAFYEKFPDMNPANQKQYTKEELEKPSKKVQKKQRYVDASAWGSGYNAAEGINLNRNRSAGDRKEQLQ